MGLDGTKTQPFTLVVLLLGLLSSGFTGVVAWTYVGLVSDVKNLGSLAPLNHERIQALREQSQSDKQMITQLQTIVANQERNAALFQQRLNAIEEHLRLIADYLEVYRGFSKGKRNPPAD